MSEVNPDEGNVQPPDVFIPETDPSDLDNHDDEDVAALLARETGDGPGFQDDHELPAANWDGYATEGVEEETS